MSVSRLTVIRLTPAQAEALHQLLVAGLDARMVELHALAIARPSGHEAAARAEVLGQQIAEGVAVAAMLQDAGPREGLQLAGQ